MSISKAVTFTVIVVTLLLATLGAWSFARSARPSAGSDGKQKEATQVRKIPLKSIYSTNGQEGPISVRGGRGEPYDRFLAEMYRKTYGMGASNVFLVRADDLAAAIRATYFVFLGGRPVDRPTDPDDQLKHTKIWLAIYFGVTGSEPPGWLVKSVEQNGKTIRVTYVQQQPETKDLHQYFVWVPLGVLEGGTYALELFDGEKKEITLLRRVVVPGK